MKIRSRVFDGGLAALLLLGVPLVLLNRSGLPWHLRHHQALGITLAELLVWLAWFWCAAGVIRSVVLRIRSRDLTPTRGAHSLDRLALRVAAGILAVSSFFVSTAGGATPAKPSNASANSPAATVSTTTASTTPSANSSAEVAASSRNTTTNILVSAPQSSTSYPVVSGDCLWSIAEKLFGDGDQWPLIAQANLGHVMNDGRLFVDPSLIYPGWLLTIPPEASSVGTSQTALVPASRPLAEVPTRPSRHLESARSAPSDFQRNAIILATSLGGGSVLLGLLARRRKRRGPLVAESADELIDADISLHSARMLPATSLLEKAVLLAAGDDILNEVGLLQISEDGARFFVDGRQRWSAMPSDLSGDIHVDGVPCAVLPLGDDGPCSWSLLVPSGTMAPLAGDGASSLVDAARALQTEFCWGDFLAEEESPFNDTRSLLLRVDERSSERARAGVALVSLGQEADVIIEHNVVSVGSLGLSFPSAHVSDVAFDLLEDEASNGSDTFSLDSPQLATDLDDPSQAPIDQTAVGLRVLCAQPHFEGLPEPLEPKRERRAVELVTYLALHAPEPVTGDRLRTRVLGTSQADAAAKTLFNVASAARRALGLDENGTPLLPPATRQGHYRISNELSCDVTQLFAHFSLADTADDEVALAHLRAGLWLIDGEPLAATLVGWDWFVAEGHRARLDAAVEHAGTRLVALALDLGYETLAREGLRRARLVVPYSETLAAAAMSIAAAERDPDALRRAFDELGRLVEDLEPGSWPLPTAEEHYRRLRQEIVDQASLAAMDAAPRNTRPSAPAAL